MISTKIKVFAFLASLFAMFAPSAFAASAYDTLTSSITFADVVVAIMAVAALLSAYYVTLFGVKNILGFIRRGG